MNIVSFFNRQALFLILQIFEMQREDQKDESKYLQLFMKSPMPMWIYEYNSKAFLEVNEEAIKQYGYSREEFLTMAVKDIRPPEDVPRLKNIQFNSIYTGAWKHLTKSGQLLYVEVIAYRIGYKNKDAVLAVINNITDKVKAEQLREFERRDKEALINNTQDFLWSVNKNLELIAANHAFLDNIKKASGVELKPGDSVLIPSFPAEFLAYWKQIYTKALSGTAFEEEVFSPARQGVEGRWLEVKFNPIYDGGELVGIACYSRNITERKRYEEESRISQEKRRHEIAEAVIAAQESERQDLGLELHDNINQILASARLYLDIIKEDESEGLAVKSKVNELLGSAIEEIRRLSHALIAPSLGKTRLPEAIEVILDTVSKTKGISIHKQFTNINEKAIEDKLKLSIYRIVQEQVNNIQKYAAAQNIWLTLFMNDEQLLLVIKDDGVGFDVTHKRKGVGLTNIKTRASLFKGTVKITSSPGKGAELKVRFPL